MVPRGKLLTGKLDGITVLAVVGEITRKTTEKKVKITHTLKKRLTWSEPAFDLFSNDGTVNE